ncbi:hypothetical protein H0H81_009759 [Sphagnurus paluster]|uniref:Uncharacterized protein n=1 Tax=Sphagnurus paluster TaxID=117069 RepID=A0A9P7GQ77_9AGAR|nr:hypothetical protein H0H81_009759 [Sphagnurus paluster]
MDPRGPLGPSPAPLNQIPIQRATLTATEPKCSPNNTKMVHPRQMKILTVQDPPKLLNLHALADRDAHQIPNPAEVLACAWSN